MTDQSKVTLSIEGMSCASCVGRVDRGLTALRGISDVSVNLANETARFSVDGSPHLQGAVQALKDLGYPARTASVPIERPLSVKSPARTRTAPVATASVMLPAEVSTAE